MSLYGQWQRERAGRFFGLSGPAFVGCAAAGLPVLGAVGARMWWAVLIAVPVWLVLAVLIAFPVRGRPAMRWLADWLRAQAGRVSGATRFESKAVSGRTWE